MGDDLVQTGVKMGLISDRSRKEKIPSTLFHFTLNDDQMTSVEIGRRIGHRSNHISFEIILWN